MQMICHGISTGALFMLVGALQQRLHTREMSRMGGLWSTVPRIGATGLFFALASLGLPGLGNFVAEFLVLLGTYRTNVAMAVLATSGLVLATVYSLWMIQATFFGADKEEWKVPDFSLREMSAMAVMIAILLFLGLSPQLILHTAQPSLNHLQEIAGEHRMKGIETESLTDLPVDIGSGAQLLSNGRGTK